MATDVSIASVTTTEIPGFVYTKIGNRETVSVLGCRIYVRLGSLSIARLPGFAYKTIGSFWVVVMLGVCVLKYTEFLSIPGGYARL